MLTIKSIKNKVGLVFIIVIISELVCLAEQDSRVCFRKKCFSVEQAVNPSQRHKGLMNRAKLEKNKGMLFVYDQEGKHGFWMKNVKIPLDIIWINQDKEVVFIKENFLPCLEKNCPAVNPKKPAKYILELNAGTVDSLGLKPKDKLQIYISK